MDINEIIKSKIIVVIALVILGLAFLMGAFSLGVKVGYHRERFSCAWGEYYDRNFGGPPRGIMGFREGPMPIDAHGTFGSIIKISNSDIIIKGADNIEKVVSVSDQTEITKFRDPVRKEDLKTDDKIVVIGEPGGQGQIVARFIRILP